jgi:hypothetical protein
MLEKSTFQSVYGPSFSFESHIDKIIQKEGLEWVLPTEIPDPSCPALILRKERLHQALATEEHKLLQSFHFMSYKRNLSVIVGKSLQVSDQD